jgi:asparagine synthase (glutamine-hydrolysing)
MCGIAGVVSRRPDASPLSGAADAMLAAVRHRGPDDHGTWQSCRGQAAFAHARLSVLDVSAAGHQPMAVADRRYTITYNGEIYNFTELKAGLLQSGAEFRSRSDTEVILRLYQSHGPRCVELLRGMFAFAIWDEQERTCFIARDRFGIKPLYYHQAGGTLMFASEVRALVAAGVPPAVDATAAYQFFRTGSVPEPLTLIQGVRVLEAGHSMMWRDGQVTASRYWDINFPAAEAVADPTVLTRDALLDSVAHHFVSDVPVGVFLSGGMDSTAIVALARTLRTGDLRTFSLAFPGSPLDEGPDARRTAEHFKTTHHEWAVDGRTARQLFDQFLAAADQPSIDGFNTYTVCRLARRHDTKVVLSGLGGDELFGGYPSFRVVPRLARLRQLARLGGPVSAAAVRLAGEVGGSRLKRLTDLMSSPAEIESAYAVFRGIFTDDEARILTAHYLGAAPGTDADQAHGASDPTAEDAVSRLELTRYMRNQLLRDADVMSMASGVELRVPFVDSMLFDTVSKISAGQRLKRGKALLRQAVPEMPASIADRPKRGFTLPIGQWLEREWAGTIPAIDPPSTVPIDTWYRKWALLAFEQWLHRLVPQRV